MGFPAFVGHYIELMMNVSASASSTNLSRFATNLPAWTVALFEYDCMRYIGSFRADLCSSIFAGLV